MKNKLGIFLNNTNSKIKICVNINNYYKLKDNFDHIIILDINNVFSKKLKNIILKNINNITDNTINNKIINDDSINDDSINDDSINDDIVFDDIINDDITNNDITNDDITNDDITNSDIKNNDLKNDDIINNSVINNELNNTDNKEKINYEKKNIFNKFEKTNRFYNKDYFNKKNKIYKYILNNNLKKNDFDDLAKDNIINILNNLDYKKFDYITFINDNYIYCENLKDYFNYVNKYQLDFYSYTDSTEYIYHFQLYLFTIKSSSVLKFKKFINTTIDENIVFKIHLLFEKKMPFLKIAYLKNNIDNNIFHNTKFFYELIKKKILPIINLNMLFSIKNNYKYTFYQNIPEYFDIDIYKSNKDLAHYNDEQLYSHFLNYGQYEFRVFSNYNYVLPKFIRNYLKEYNILIYFDVPEDFNVFKYREYNSDLNNLNIRDLLIHWINYGYYEDRKYL